MRYSRTNWDALIASAPANADAARAMAVSYQEPYAEPSLPEEPSAPEEPAPFLVHIAPSMMQQAWEHIEPLLSKACADSRGEFTIPLILANLEHWPILAIVRGDAVQAVMVTCVSLQPHRRVLDCLLASGDHAKDWPLVDDDFDTFARGFGCSAVRIPHARKGWQRTLPHWDWTGIVLERKI